VVSLHAPRDFGSDSVACAEEEEAVTFARGPGAEQRKQVRAVDIVLHVHSAEAGREADAAAISEDCRLPGEHTRIGRIGGGLVQAVRVDESEALSHVEFHRRCDLGEGLLHRYIGHADTQHVYDAGSRMPCRSR